MTVDSRQFRDALGTFPSGVTVMTSGVAPNYHAMTAQSFSALSLDPPLVLLCVDKAANMLGVVKETGAFSVNVLSARQEATAAYFASGDRPTPPKEFEDVEYTLGETGTPRLAGATTVFDCTLHGVLDGGDHEIVVGEVKAFAHQNHHDPVLFFRGRYRTLSAARRL